LGQLPGQTDDAAIQIRQCSSWPHRGVPVAGELPVPSTIFLFAFIAKGLGDQMPVSRRAFFFAELFSFFCYTLELQRLGEALMREKKESGDRLNRN
jgi:hypothetical protein